jgi:hypothetical protein
LAIEYEIFLMKYKKPLCLNLEKGFFILSKCCSFTRKKCRLPCAHQCGNEAQILDGRGQRKQQFNLAIAFGRASKK